MGPTLPILQFYSKYFVKRGGEQVKPILKRTEEFVKTFGNLMTKNKEIFSTKWSKGGGWGGGGVGSKAF